MPRMYVHPLVIRIRQRLSDEMITSINETLKTHRIAFAGGVLSELFENGTVVRWDFDSREATIEAADLIIDLFEYTCRDNLFTRFCIPDVGEEIRVFRVLESYAGGRPALIGCPQPFANSGDE